MTNLKHLPNSVEELLFCDDNPCYPIYQELGFNGIHEQNNTPDIKEPECD
jgi:hypothetical protein